MKRGFTLVEIMVVIGILSLLILVVSVNIRSFQTHSQVTQAAEELASILREAQSRSMAVVNGQNHGIHFDEDSNAYTLFEGTVFSEGAPTNVVYSLDISIELTSVSLADAGSDVVFEKLTGSTTDSGLVTIASKLDGSVNQTVTITNEGKISAQ